MHWAPAVSFTVHLTHLFIIAIPSPTPPVSPPSGLSGGVIAGAVITVIVIILAVLAAVAVIVFVIYKKGLCGSIMVTLLGCCKKSKSAEVALVEYCKYSTHLSVKLTILL